MKSLTIRQKQRIGAVFIILIGLGFTIWGWYTRLFDGYFYEKSAILFPSFIVVGFALLFFPGYKEERLARGEDISGLQGYRIITKRWWIIICIGIVAGFANYILLSSNF